MSFNQTIDGEKVEIGLPMVSNNNLRGDVDLNSKIEKGTELTVIYPLEVVKTLEPLNIHFEGIDDILSLKIK